jgi:hypothetical protein
VPIPPPPQKPAYLDKVSPPQTPEGRLLPSLPGPLPETPAPALLRQSLLASNAQRAPQPSYPAEAPIFFSPSQAYTSRAAERWRKSWQERQYAEAGPAEHVSKGHAAVTSPLRSMQQSFARMRAIVLAPDKDQRKINLGFWITILLMLSIIAGLGAYIIDTYLPNSSSTAVHTSQPAAVQSPEPGIIGTSQIIPASTPVTSSPDLSITLNGQPVTTLSFTKRIGAPDPDAQRITITNTSGSVLNWSAAVTTANNLGWLVIEDNNYAGQLAISEPQQIGIGVDTNGLGVSPQGKPYAGQVLFTINNKQVLTLRVQLTITNAATELVFSPTPIIATANPDGSCQAGATLTLINLGYVPLTWAVNPDLPYFIRLVDSNGKSSGILNPSGTAGDTVVLNLSCTNVRSGQSYHISIYGNSIQASDTVQLQ